MYSQYTMGMQAGMFGRGGGEATGEGGIGVPARNPSAARGGAGRGLDTKSHCAAACFVL